jgi:hypothetical protein
MILACLVTISVFYFRGDYLRHTEASFRFDFCGRILYLENPNPVTVVHVFFVMRLYVRGGE